MWAGDCFLTPASISRTMPTTAEDSRVIGGGPDLGLCASDLGNSQAERQPDARRLGAQANGDLSASRLSGDLEAAEARHGLDRIAHGIGAELGPALAPEI